MALTGANLRTRNQIDRLITTVIVSSIPVALYGVIQRAGLDPHPIPFEDHLERVISTGGHPIFLAAYLGLTIPVTVWRLLDIALQGGSLDAKRKAAFTLYALALATEITGFVLANSRGPLLGLCSAVIFMIIGFAAVAKKSRFLALPLILICAAFAFLVVLNIPGGPLSSLAELPLLHRFSHFVTNTRGSDTYRAAFWNTAERVLTENTQLPYPTGGLDNLRTWRWLIGFGPETVSNAMPHYYVYNEPGANLESRLHNVFWDTWFETGAIGLAAFLLLNAMLFFLAYQRLGLLAAPGSRSFFWAIIVTASLGGAALGAAREIGYAGPGAMTGFVAGLAVIPLTQRISKTENDALAETNSMDLLIVALLSCIAGHLVETSFAFSVAMTLPLVFVFSGCIIALSLRSGTQADSSIAFPVEEKSARNKSRVLPTPTGSILTSSLITAAILVTLLFGFVEIYTYEALTPGTILKMTLTRIKNEQGCSHLIEYLLLPTWIFASTAFAFDASGKRLEKVFWSHLALVLLGSAIPSIVFAFIRASQISSIGPIPRASAPAEAVLRAGSGYELLWVAFVLTTLALLAGTAVGIASEQKGGPRKTPSPPLSVGIAAFILFATAGIISWQSSLKPVLADMEAAWGNALAALNRHALSIEAFRQAVREQPEPIVYHRFLAMHLEQLAEGPTASDQMESRFAEAEQTLESATSRAHGLNRSFAQLTDIYLHWAAKEPDHERQLAISRKALVTLEKALIYEPGGELLWIEKAADYSAFLHDATNSESAMAQASRIRQDPIAWGSYVKDLAFSAPSPALFTAYARCSVQLYETGISRLPSKVAAAAGFRGKGITELSLGDLDQAEKDLSSADNSGKDGWEGEAALAQLYFRKHNLALSRQYLDSATSDCPDDLKSTLMQLRRQMGF